MKLWSHSIAGQKICNPGWNWDDEVNLSLPVFLSLNFGTMSSVLSLKYLWNWHFSSVERAGCFDVSTCHVNCHHVAEECADQVSRFAPVFRTQPVEVWVEADLSLSPDGSSGACPVLSDNCHLNVSAVKRGVVHRLVQVEADLMSLTEACVRVYRPLFAVLSLEIVWKMLWLELHSQ